MKRKIGNIYKIMTILISILMMCSVFVNADICNLLDCNDDPTIHSFDLGYMSIDGAQWGEENSQICIETLNNEYISISSYYEGDIINLSVDWEILSDTALWTEPPWDGIELPTWCNEKWNFTITVHDKLSSDEEEPDIESYDVYEKAVVSIEDIFGVSQAGENGRLYLEFTLPRYNFYYDELCDLEVEINTLYYRWCEKPAHHPHWGELGDGNMVLTSADFDVYFSGPNSAPFITYQADDLPSNREIKFGTRDGPSDEGKVSFTVTAEDPDGDPIKFKFDWDGDEYDEYNDGDRSYIDGTDWFESGDTITVSHRWIKENYPDERSHIANTTVQVVDKLYSGYSDWYSFGEFTLPKCKRLDKTSQIIPLNEIINILILGQLNFIQQILKLLSSNF